MGREDLSAVAGIEQETLSPWSLSILEEELRARHRRQLIVEFPGGRIAGWCACRTVWPEAELLKIAVVEGERHHGLGTLLLEALFKELRGQAYSELFLEVRARNVAALQFYKKLGFRQVGLRSGYYSDPADDAVLLRKELEAIHETQPNIDEDRNEIST